MMRNKPHPQTYAIKEIYKSLQGEGFHTGRRCVFVRFAGCNVWTGQEKHRKRDTMNGVCAAWCDTDFVGTDGRNGGRLTTKEIIRAVDAEMPGNAHTAPNRGKPFVVLTGGEPGLQITGWLVDAFHDAGYDVHVETNGSVRLPATIDWVTLSPKPPMPVRITRVDEVKIIHELTMNFEDLERFYRRDLPPNRHFLQPCFTEDKKQFAINTNVARLAVQNSGWWRLSIQTHKTIGIP